MRTYYVYILTNHARTLYVGMTNNLARRMGQHNDGEGSVFTHKYKLDQLAYFEEFVDVRDAIAREKQIKGWRREKKIALIASMNPHWDDLRAGLCG